MSVETRQSTILPRPRQRLVWLLGLGAVGLAALAAGLMLLARPRQSELPILAQVPSFSAVRQDGSTVTEQSWAGSIWVADFIFTRCPNSCPAITSKLAGLQTLSEGRLPQLKLVSFTVDPEYDTPERLTAYGGKYQADFRRWAFLTPSREDLEKVISPGFMQTLVRGDGRDLGTVVHSSYLVLVDRRLRVRGFYHSSESNAVEALLRDAEALARTP